MKSVLLSLYIKAKTSAENRGRVKPIECRAGFVILSLHLFVLLGKGFAKAYRQPYLHKLGFCYVRKSYRTLETVSSIVGVSLAFRTFELEAVGYTNGRHVAKIFTPCYHV